MKLLITRGATSQRAVVFIQDASKTTGVGLTGLTHSSSGLIWYWFNSASGTSTSVSVTGETLGTWTSGGFVEVDATHMPGFYELGIPNAVLSGTPIWSVMQLSGVTNMVPVNVEIQNTAIDVTNGLNMNISSLPTISAGGGSGGIALAVGNSNIVNIGQWLGTAVTAATGGVPDVNVKNYNNQTAATDANNLPKVDVQDFGGTAGTFTSGVPNANASLSGTATANVVSWLGTAVSGTAGIPDINVKQWHNSAVASPADAGYPDVNVKFYNGVTAQTDGNGLPNVDVVDWIGGAIPAVNITGVPVVDVGAFGGTGATFSGSFPEVAVATNLDKTGYALATGGISVKKDTLLNGFTFPMFSAAAPNGLATGLSVTATRSIDGGSVAGTTNAVSEVGSGVYKINLSAADLNGNSITFLFTASGALDSAITIVTQA